MGRRKKTAHATQHTLRSPATKPTSTTTGTVRSLFTRQPFWLFTENLLIAEREANPDKKDDKKDDKKADKKGDDKKADDQKADDQKPDDKKAEGGGSMGFQVH